jgi:hypothetical protein
MKQCTVRASLRMLNKAREHGWRKKLKAYAPQDKELFEIGEALQEAQKQVKWGASASIKHRGHYYHSRCMDVDVDYGDISWTHDAPANMITQAIRDFADWIYKRLEAEWDYLTSDEAVDESIKANEYEFTKEGKLA